MADRGFHFFLRTDRHRDHLLGKEREVETAVRKASRGVGKRVRVRVEPSHFHIFAGVEVGREREFVRRIRGSVSSMEGVKWDAEHYMIPMSSFTRRYVDRLIEDLHKEHFL